MRLSVIVLGSGHPASRIFSLLSTMPAFDRGVGMKIAVELLCRHLQNYVMQTSNSLGVLEPGRELRCYPRESAAVRRIYRRHHRSHEVLRAPIQVVKRDSQSVLPVHPPPSSDKRVTHELPGAVESSLCPPPKFVDMGKGLGIFGPSISLDGSNNTADEIMRHCYTFRANALKAGRATAMMKGGASMWPSTNKNSESEPSG